MPVETPTWPRAAGERGSFAGVSTTVLLPSLFTTLSSLHSVSHSVSSVFGRLLPTSELVT